jgi:Trk-type K+ transport system membrane component
LYASDVRFNSTLHITVALLIILGGIGFPVLMSFYSRLKYSFAVLLRKLQGKFKPVNPVRKDVAGSIVIFMTVLLVIGGTIIYYLFESENSLKGNDNIHKIIISFFGSVSSRTAGFNISDLTLWSYPTVYLMIFLMWIGASPGSTGGGIKTTTFALAFRTAWNNIRGRERIKISNREISNSTVSRVLSIVFLSLMLIGGGFFCLLLTESGKDPAYLLFECFSAYGTVGLSIADSGTFSSAGKIVDIILMFVGRVGPLTLFTGLLVSSRKIYSKYPEVDLVIN